MPLRTSSSLVLPDVWTNLLMSAHIVAHAYERTFHPSIHPHERKLVKSSKKRGSHIFFGTDADERYTRMWMISSRPCCLRPRHALHRKVWERMKGPEKEIRDWQRTGFKFIKTLNKTPINLEEYTEHTLHYYYYKHHQMESTCSRLELETLGSRRISPYNILWHGFQILHGSGSEFRGPSPLMKLRNGLSISSDGNSFSGNFHTTLLINTTLLANDLRAVLHTRKNDEGFKMVIVNGPKTMTTRNSHHSF